MPQSTINEAMRPSAIVFWWDQLPRFPQKKTMQRDRKKVGGGTHLPRVIGTAETLGGL